VIQRDDDKVAKALTVTSSDAEGAKKAYMLLKFHLKNQEVLDRTEKRMQKVQSDITAVQVSS